MAEKGNPQQPLAPEELGSLYPTPATSDQKRAELEARQEYFDTIRTRMAAFKIAFLGSILMPVVIYYALNVESLWLIRSTPVIVGSYVIWAILGLFVFKWMRYTANIFYEYSRSAVLFWILYAFSMGLVVLAWYKGVWLESSSIYWIGILTIAQLIVTYGCAKLLLRHR